MFNLVSRLRVQKLTTLRQTVMNSKNNSARIADQLLMRDIVGKVRLPMRRVVGLLGVVLICQAVFMFVLGADYAVPFLLVGITSWLAFSVGVFCNTGGLPVYSVLMIQHGIVYSVPLAVQNSMLAKYDKDVVYTAAFAYVVFVLISIVGWQIGKAFSSASKSTWILFEQGSAKITYRFIARAGISLIALAVAFQVSLITNIYWSSLGQYAPILFPIFKAVIGPGQIAGAFLGAYAISHLPSHRTIFWMVWCSLFTLLMATVLLSSATGFVIGTMGGLYLGSRRMAWLPAIVIFGVLGFLNVGKFEIRTKYWSDQNGIQVGLFQLPSFFSEWFSASIEKITKRRDEYSRSEEKGQSISERILGFENLCFVTRALSNLGYEPLGGQGYAVLPKVMVPRILWAGKPRSHEGQVLLNLHFDRQKNIKATQRTYVAWGLLPEAVGNFGIWIGAIGFGMVSGILTGMLETWSTRKSLLSIEGIGACILMIYAFISFEMSAGVLLGMLYQTAIVIVAGGIVMMQFRKRSSPKLKSRRPAAMDGRG